MKAETEQMVRSILGMDREIAAEDVEKAIRVLKGEPDDNRDLVHVMKRKDVMKLLGIHRRTLDYYLERGYLDRVYGGGERAIGVSRESFLRFQSQRVGKKTGNVV